MRIAHHHWGQGCGHPLSGVSRQEQEGAADDLMLYFIGLGLGDEKDITVRGREAVASCKRVYLDGYTSILPGVDAAALAAAYGVPAIVVADRETVECNAEMILAGAGEEDVAFLVVGDPFGATTHTDLYVRAARRGIPTRVIHNASIINAVGGCGLQLYTFGAVVSIPYFTPTWRPSSFYDHIDANRARGLHTLCLLDIKVKERTDENILKDRPIYEPARFMSVREALHQLVEVEAERGKGHCAGGALVVALMRVGRTDQRILAGTVEELLACGDDTFGGPLHSLVVPAPTLHEVEYAMLASFAVAPASSLARLSYAEYCCRTTTKIDTASSI